MTCSFPVLFSSSSLFFPLLSFFPFSLFSPSLFFPFLFFPFSFCIKERGQPHSAHWEGLKYWYATTVLPAGSCHRPHSLLGDQATNHTVTFFAAQPNPFYRCPDSLAHRASEPNMDPDLSQKILDAVAADPETVRRLGCDIAPAAEPVADYITDLEERCRLFDEWRQFHRQVNKPPPNAALLGFTMVAPISEIRTQMSNLRAMPTPGGGVWASGLNTDALLAISACTFVSSIICPT